MQTDIHNTQDTISLTRTVSSDGSCSGTMGYEQTSMLHAQTTMVHEQKPYNTKTCECDTGAKNMSWNMLKWTEHMNKGNIKA